MSLMPLYDSAAAMSCVSPWCSTVVVVIYFFFFSFILLLGGRKLIITPLKSGRRAQKETGTLTRECPPVAADALDGAKCRNRG